MIYQEVLINPSNFFDLFGLTLNTSCWPQLQECELLASSVSCWPQAQECELLASGARVRAVGLRRKSASCWPESQECELLA